MAKVKKLKKDELEKLQGLNNQFQGAKLQLGDLEISKHNLLEQVKGLKLQFAQLEADLIKAYGDTVVIDLKSGEVKEKQVNGENKQ